MTNEEFLAFLEAKAERALAAEHMTTHLSVKNGTRLREMLGMRGEYHTTKPHPIHMLATVDAARKVLVERAIKKVVG
jgi:purine nucleoside phosphorylase